MEIPDGWKVPSIGNVSEYVTSGSRGWAKYYSEQGCRFIRITNLRRDNIIPDYANLKFVELPNGSSEGQRTRLEEGDILISITADLGVIGFVDQPPTISSYINQHISLVRLDHRKVFPRFVAYFLASKKQENAIKRMNDAGAKAGLSLTTIRQIKLLTPPLPEQQKIATILSTWDAAIANQQKLIAACEAQKKALMQQLLTAKKRLKGFDGEWEEVKVSKCATIAKGKALSSKNLQEGNYPVIAGGKTSPYTHSEYTHENIITVSASGAYAGYVAKHPYKLWASDCSVIKNNSDSELEFIFQYLSLHQNKIYSLQSGGAQPHIYPKDLAALTINLPPLSEQTAIAAILSEADREIELEQQKLAILRQEKAALMQQLLTGKRRVKLNNKEIAA